jgi:hypothetical protein
MKYITILTLSTISTAIFFFLFFKKKQEKKIYEENYSKLSDLYVPIPWDTRYSIKEIFQDFQKFNFKWKYNYFTIILNCDIPILESLYESELQIYIQKLMFYFLEENKRNSFMTGYSTIKFKNGKFIKNRELTTVFYGSFDVYYLEIQDNLNRFSIISWYKEDSVPPKLIDSVIYSKKKRCFTDQNKTVITIHDFIKHIEDMISQPYILNMHLTQIHCIN